MEKTTASQALEILNQQFSIPAHQYGGLKKYLMLCHGCGTLHVQEAYFISTPLGFSAKFADGSSICLGCHGCEACRVNPEKPIKRAWENGMSAEAREKANAAIKGELQ